MQNNVVLYSGAWTHKSDDRSRSGACDSFLPETDQKSEKLLRRASTTEMSVKAFETTARMDEMLSKEVAFFKPDLIVSDSVCFWGKLIAEKHQLPLVCSTITFAFNQFSSKYLKYSTVEIIDMIFGLPRLNRALKLLKPLGYHVKSALDIVQSKSDTNTIVYTSEHFQPFAETFDVTHYRFVGPSVRKTEVRRSADQRTKIYISLGTVINNHPKFYRNCIDGLKDLNADILISCGKAFDPQMLGVLPRNVKVEQHVNQMEVLSDANIFITHCGMNSASEGLYMGVPELLFPLTGEQQAVAKRVCEMGAGVLLSQKEATTPEGIRNAVVNVLENEELLYGAQKMRADFLACSGPAGAADFVESLIS